MINRIINKIHCADCLEFMKSMPDNSVDLVFTSPPYEDARTYGIDFKLRGQDWVDWCVPRFMECLRVCRGLVAWVVEGKTRKFRWSATPALLMADLHRAGAHLRKPPAFQRYGVPGSGGPDWLRNDYEFIVCASEGRLPWSDNTATGQKPLYRVGGLMSNRHKDGQRTNRPRTNKRTTHKRYVTGGDNYRGTETTVKFKQPKMANPGNVIRCKVGGGHLGSPLAHENEAPFPESLAIPFVRSFCPLGGIMLDPFSGSATTAASAKKYGRRWIAIDIRQSQVELGNRRLKNTKTEVIKK